MADIGWLTLLAGGGGTFIVTLLTFWMALASKIEGSNSASKGAAERADRAEGIAQMTMAKQDLLAREVSEIKAETGARIAGLQATTAETSRSLHQAESRLAKSIEDVGEKIDALSQTMMRTLGELISKRGERQ